MNFDYELILFYAVLITGALALGDRVFLAPKRRRMAAGVAKTPLILDYARDFFPILLLVFCLRSFLFEPFRIPSGSLKPTLLVGDFVLVNKFAYGIRLPVLHKKIIALQNPKRGDIVVFRAPKTTGMDMIKRVIGVPGDRISYINKVLYINGKPMLQQLEKYTTDTEGEWGTWTVAQKHENLFGVTHDIFQIPDKPEDDFYNVIVPAGHYFMMGDNRDDSADSRAWGFMPDKNIIGKASRVLISWDHLTHPLRWSRTGMKII